jgi:ribonuclease BN (tRNA processing enzyme)
LVTAPDTPPLVIDFGGGVLGTLQRHADPGTVGVLLSHLHADHCLDLPGLFVWRRYHPQPPEGRALMYGPDATWARLGAASSPEGKEIDDFSDIFEIHKWVDKKAVQIGELTVVPRLVCHPTESYGMRFTDPSGATFVYSGDTGYCDALSVRGVVDAFARPAPETASVGHGGWSRREEGRCRRTALDPHPAVDVARGRDQRGEG